jgi:glycosyltransferase involved in cell wall biosynthesis
MRLALVGRRFTHHATHSGYDQIAQHLGVQRTWFDAQKDIDLPQADIVDFIYAENDYRLDRFRLPAGAKIVGTFHQPPRQLEQFDVTAATVRSLDAVVIVGSSQSDFFTHHGARRIYTVKHGIDCEFYHPSEAPVVEKHRILSVGYWLRDVDLFLRVARRAERFHLPLTFHIVPGVSLGNQSLPGNTFPYRNLSDGELRRQYQRAACLFLPLVDVTACNALLEAIACGTPYVTSDVGSVRDYVDETGGVLMRGTDEDAWLEALISLAGLPPSHHEKSIGARALALRLNWPHVASSLTSAFADIAVS